MRTTQIGRWLEKNNKPFVALLAAGATLAMATLIDASSSSQVEQLGQMAIHRSAHKATALSDGRALITGGRNTAGIVIADAEIFDPNTGESSAVAPMGTARVDHTATLLTDGRVLITGGSNATGTLNSAEIFDPSTGTFSAVSGRLNMARARHTATLLSSGKVLIAGGDVTPTLVDPNGTDVTGTAEIFDPTARTFGDLILLQRSRSGHSATLFSNDTVWLVGGGNNTIESFSAGAEAFTLSDTTMTAMRSGHDAIALSDTRLLFLGGDPDHTIDELNPSTDVLTLKATMDSAQSSATLLANGKILVLSPNVAGVYSPDATDQATAFSAFDETTVPDSTTLKRSGQTATELLGDKTILIAGGENAQHQPSLQIATFNPARIWTDKDDYLPGDNVVLTGSGWKPNENVYLYAVDDTTEAWTYGSTVAADSSGGFVVNPYFVVQLVQLGANFSVSAVGAQSAMQADVKFTDSSNKIDHIAFYETGPATFTSNTTNGALGVQLQNNDTPPTAEKITGGSGSVQISITSSSATGRFDTSSGGSFTLTSLTQNAVSGDDHFVDFYYKDSATGSVTITAIVTAVAGQVPSSVVGKTATLVKTLNPAPTSLAVSSASGTYGGTVNLTATLTSGASGLSGKTIAFTLNGTSVGSATTNSSGVATLNNASLSGINAGTYATGVGASFGASGGYQASSGSASLTVAKVNATWTTNPNNKNYGDADPNPLTTGSGSGFLAADNVTATYTRATGETVAGSPYHITATLSPAGVLNNYNITNAGAAFTINTRNATWTTNPNSKSYGDADPNPLTMGSGTGFLAADNVTATYIRASGENPSPPTYHITATLSAAAGVLANYNITNAGAEFTINKRNATWTTDPAHKTYGDADANPLTTGSGNFLAADGVTATYSRAPGEAVAGGPYHITATLNAAAGVLAKYNITNDGAAFTINKANATVVVTPYNVTYDGHAHMATITSITGVNSETGATVGTVDVSHTAHTNAGTFASDSWSFAGTANYNDIAATTITDVINKVDATVVVTPYDVTYDGHAHTAAITSVTGVNGETGATVGAVDVSNTSHTNAGMYVSDYWFFTATANYNNIGDTTITDKINKADATVVVTPYNVTYDGHEHMATITSITGVNGETGAMVGTADVSHTAHTNAGTFASDYWSFAGTANYNDIAAMTITDTINKANAMVVVAPYNVTYDGHEHMATITSITGVNSETGATVGTVDVTNTKHTNAGTYNTDSWSFAGTANYNNIAATTITDVINKADASIVVTPYDVTYDGHAHTAAITSITGVNGETGATVGVVDVSHTSHTPAGTYSNDTWSFTGGANYNDIAATTITDHIAKANATFTVTPYDVTYDGSEHTASISAITGVNGETGATVGIVNLGNTKHTNAGTFVTDSWSFTGTANYNDIAGTTITDHIAKADAAFTVTPYTSLTTTYDGNAHMATVSTITGVNGEMEATVGTVDVSHTTNTNAGTYASDYWFFTGTANYNDIGNTIINDSIGKANAVVVVTTYDLTYDAHSHTATVTSITGVNSETGMTVGTVDVSHTTNTNAGTYASDYWSFTGTANYNDIAAATITDKIAKADAGIVTHDYSGTYDANSHGVTATITGVDAGGTAAGSSFSSDMLTNVPGGTVKWSLTGGTNYNDASGTGNVTIGKATATIHVMPYTSVTTTYDAASHTATATVTGVDTGGTAAGTSLDLSGTTHTNAGTYNNDPWSFSGGTNYYNVTGTVNDSIAKATAVITVTKYNVTYNGLSHTATGSAQGVDAGGAALGSSFNLSGTTHTNAGTYTGDAWSFSGGTNYNDVSGTVNDSIGQANLTVTADNQTIVLHAALPTFTVKYAGFVNGEMASVLSGTLTFTPTTTPANAGKYNIVPSGYTSNNYAITFQKGTLTVMYSASCIIFGDPTRAILQPINPDGSSVNKAGSTVPAKFRVGDANCNSVGTPGVVTAFNLILRSSDPGAQINEVVDSTTPDTAFRWDPTAQQWIFNISTKGMASGVKYTYQISLNDGSSIVFAFALK
jgi:hypothetical protein